MREEKRVSIGMSLKKTCPGTGAVQAWGRQTLPSRY